MTTAETRQKASKIISWVLKITGPYSSYLVSFAILAFAVGCLVIGSLSFDRGQLLQTYLFEDQFDCTVFKSSVISCDFSDSCVYRLFAVVFFHPPTNPDALYHDSISPTWNTKFTWRARADRALASITPGTAGRCSVNQDGHPVMWQLVGLSDIFWPISPWHVAGVLGLISVAVYLALSLFVYYFR
ncbi:hypothetical protein J8273_6675 [Carpediemonas membranifera]|uniref:Uncharacterized protein n=1 Tax=Carpediemonas membranifera TaxID=201153 RepID=A0A8J6ARG0_9EUKA|nr:hypothetical protein J8273_6675 [Carpediemonas membranifera]|eukprot:KAG9392083.1 hypothetical protein J8273_6675 [Carpediemonas membranifera]